MSCLAWAMSILVAVCVSCTICEEVWRTRPDRKVSTIHITALFRAQQALEKSREILDVLMVIFVQVDQLASDFLIRELDTYIYIYIYVHK